MSRENSTTAQQLVGCAPNSKKKWWAQPTLLWASGNWSGVATRTLIICVLLCLAPPLRGAESVQDSQKDSVGHPQGGVPLQIYLPREVTIEDNNLTLGQVSIIRGEDSLVAKASDISLGQFSVPGQRIVVDRLTALSRLACNGIPASKVTLTGAEKVTVKRQHQVIKGSEFVELASSFLKKNLPADSVCQLDPVDIPKDMILAGLIKNVRLSPRLVQGGSRNQARVQITVFSDGKEVGVCEVTFRLKYNRRTIVTLVEIPAGEVISPENVKIENIVSNYPEPANFSSLLFYPQGDGTQNGVPAERRPAENLTYGLIARRRLPANTVISPDMIGPAGPVAVVQCNETVVIQIKRPGILITALGKAMQKGKAGEYIKVRNLDSQRIILAKVGEDGAVEPIF